MNEIYDCINSMNDFSGKKLKLFLNTKFTYIIKIILFNTNLSYFIYVKMILYH